MFLTCSVYKLYYPGFCRMAQRKFKESLIDMRGDIRRQDGVVVEEK